ncbi:ribosome small subunit-dependent GTPase A [uncultured Desulfosarcina sp.]|uniref:ribosome small subunit-dependent GTPase A n=1 Tax=uncultured Desulfosarcina sp. TaxID=218289 RepID=UPI0029C823A4|nr:ribosome small subunit-dependent GTPase A [uncultured Desulfosarcina sp.]
MSTMKTLETAYAMDFVHSLSKLGWSPFFQTHLDNLYDGKLEPARVVGVRKNSFYVSQGKKEFLATVAGKLNHQIDCLYPVAGDWVIMTDNVIYSVLPRKNALSRGAAGRHGKEKAQPTREQVIAANLDTVFVVCGLDRDFNIRRIERCLTLIYNCGLNPAIILTKGDLQIFPEKFIRQVETVAFGVPVHLVSAKDSHGLNQLEAYLSPGKTLTMIGSSGAGKSTLVNRLYGKSVQPTGLVSENVGKGKHTTTSRDLIVMPQGGMVIDNPGIREIAFWDGDGGIELAFPEIERLSFECRFSDCSHMHEPGCRVNQALIEGEITKDRIESYHKMKREMMYLSDRRHKTSDRVEKERWKAVALKIKAAKKRRGNG